MRKRSVGWMALLGLAAAGVAACAQAPPRERPGDAQVVFKLDTHLPQPRLAAAPLFASGLTLDSAGGVFLYRADYAVQPSALFGGLAPLTRSNLPSRIGEQSIGQQFGWRLGELAGAPVEMGLRYRQQDRLATSGLSQQAQRGLDLRWAPALADFDLQWSSTSTRAAPLDCPLQGAMNVPLARLAALRVRGRNCAVVAPDLRPGAVDARSWSAALEWGRTRRSTALRLLAVDPLPGPEAVAATADPDPGYELGLLQELPLAGWQAQTSFAWRRPAGMDAGSWATDASLRRQLRGLGLSASLRQGLNNYWFLPDGAQRQHQYELGVDFSRWLAGWLPGRQPEMGMSYQWSPQAAPTAAGRGLYGSSLQWKFNLLW